MADLTATQIAAINTQLSVNLSTVTDDRLIELCLLYRSAPSVRPAFVAALNAEITRRFTPAYIAANDVMFSVLQNFANQFYTTPVAKNFADGVTKLLAATDKETWSAANTKFYQDALTVSADWNALIDNKPVFAAVCESLTAMDILLANPAFSTKTTSVEADVVTMINSSSALIAWTKSPHTRSTLINSNSYFQSKKQDIYNKVVASPKWRKQAGLVAESSDGLYPTLNAMSASGVGFVFASLGVFTAGGSGTSSIYHESSAAIAASGSITKPTSLGTLNGISFNNCTFQSIQSASGSQTYAELWVPA